MKPTTSRPAVDDAVTVHELADDTLPRVYEVADDPTPTQHAPRDQEPTPSATWVAAYAMGLVASHQQAGGLDELLAYVRAPGVPVRSALRHLEDPTVGDPQLRAGARELLETAIAYVESADQGGRSPASR